MNALKSTAGCLLAVVAAPVAVVLTLYGFVLGGGHSEGQRHESDLFCFGAFVAGATAVVGASLTRTKRSESAAEVTHPGASAEGKRHTVVHELRTEAGVFRVRLVWSVTNPARDASGELLGALGQIVAPEVTNAELAQARAALRTRFSPEGVTVHQLTLVNDADE